MFFGSDNSAKREMEANYRNELKREVQLKNSQIQKRAPDRSTGHQEAFSLIKNIESEQQIRKNKQQEYYTELREQMQREKQEKQRKQEEKHKREREQEEKLRRENEILQQRYEQEIKKDKKQQPTKSFEFPEPNDFKPLKKNRKQAIEFTPAEKQAAPIQSASRIKTSQSTQHNFDGQENLPLESQQKQGFDRGSQSIPYLNTHGNRVENEAYNFLPQKRHMNTYFQELLGERRRFQQQVDGISSLNKLFYQEKSRAGRIQSSGLQELKNLQIFLEQKGKSYSNLGENTRRINDAFELKPSGKSSLVAESRFRNEAFSSVDNTGWRKLD